LFGQSPSEVVLYDPIADDDVATYDLGRAAATVRIKGSDTANANDEGELNVGETRAAVGGNGRGAGLAHAWHVYEDDVVTADGAG
jgi:hypothetical protein